MEYFVYNSFIMTLRLISIFKLTSFFTPNGELVLLNWFFVRGIFGEPVRKTSQITKSMIANTIYSTLQCTVKPV